jgi:hypothetical protein
MNKLSSVLANNNMKNEIRYNTASSNQINTYRPISGEKRGRGRPKNSTRLYNSNLDKLHQKESYKKSCV